MQLCHFKGGIGNGVATRFLENEIQLIHHQVKGRTRFGVNFLKGNASLKVHLEKTLLTQSEVLSATANLATGTVLVFYKETLNIKNLRELIYQQLLSFPGYSDQPSPPIAKAPSSSPFTISTRSFFFILTGVTIGFYFMEDVPFILEVSASLTKKVMLNCKKQPHYEKVEIFMTVGFSILDLIC